MSSREPSSPPGAEPAPPPQYAPDGRWFWTGARWIPASEVLRPRPAPSSPAASPPRSGPRWRPWLAAAVAVVVLAAATAGGLALRPAGQRASVPPAGRVFALPFADRIGSAALRGTLISQGTMEILSGVLDLTPDRALHVTLQAGGVYAGEFVDTGGIDYQTRRPGGPWAALTPVSLVDRVLGWSGGPPPTGLRVAGREVVGGERAWHLTAASGAAWWIGVRTGHPLRFLYRHQGLALDLSFGGFGSQPAIMAPPQSNVSTLPIRGSLRTPMSAPGMSMEVNAIQSAPSTLGPAPPGYQYRALQLSYRNDAPGPVMFHNTFTLTGVHGAQYQQSRRVEMAPMLPSGLVLQPGQVVSGWDVFVVARDASPLTLRAGPQGDREDVDFLVSVPLS